MPDVRQYIIIAMLWYCVCRCAIIFMVLEMLKYISASGIFKLCDIDLRYHYAVGMLFDPKCRRMYIACIKDTLNYIKCLFPNVYTYSHVRIFRL